MVQISVFAFGAAIYSAQGRVSRLFTFPLRTTTLVAWRLLPACGTLFAASLLSTSFFNWAFAAEWPLWGPALFLAVAFAAVHAGAWLGEKSGWMIAILTAMAVILSFWFRWRYGSYTADPKHMWTEVTPAEVLTMLAMALASYARRRLWRCAKSPRRAAIFDWVLGLAGCETGHRLGRQRPFPLADSRSALVRVAPQRLVAPGWHHFHLGDWIHQLAHREP